MLCKMDDLFMTVQNILRLYFLKPPVLHASKKNVTICSGNTVESMQTFTGLSNRGIGCLKKQNSNKDEVRTDTNLVTTKIRDRKLEYLNELDFQASDPKHKEWRKVVKQFMNKQKKGISGDSPPIFFNSTLYSSSLISKTARKPSFTKEKNYQGCTIAIKSEVGGRRISSLLLKPIEKVLC